MVLVKQEERRFVLVEVRGGYLPNTTNHKSFWSNWFRWKKEEQNQLAVYKYLMSIETSEEYLITRRQKTRYYRETIQKCLPPEIKWLEHCICEEFPQTFCSDNRGLYKLHPKNDSKVSSSTLVSSYAAFIRGGRMSEPTDAQFGNKIKDMVEREGLPFTKGRNEYGRIAWIFSRRGVYDWLTENVIHGIPIGKRRRRVRWNDTSGENGVLGERMYVCNITKYNYPQYKILF